MARQPCSIAIGLAFQLVVLPLAHAKEATVVRLDPSAPRTRLVALDGAAPKSTLIPVDPGPSSSLAAGDPSGIRELPADAEVAAAPMRLPPLLRPSLSGGVPTGFVSGWGDYYISASAGTPGNLRDGVPDGSVNLGLGFGDPVQSIGMDVGWGIASVKNFNSNGSLDLTIGRVIVNRSDYQVAVAGGLIDAYSYGTETGKPPINGYGAVTLALPLRPSDAGFRQIFQISAGGGGNSFSAIDTNFQTSSSGLFVAAGVELSPALGVSIGQSSRSTNLNLSYIPFPDLPIFVNLVAADVFATTPYGTVGVLSIGWADSFRGGFFADR